MECVEQLIKFREYVLEKGETLGGPEISRIIVKSAAYLARLGEVVAEKTKEANGAYAFRKFQKATEFKRIRGELDTTIGDADRESLIAVQELKDLEIQKQYEADTLKTLYDDTERLIMTLQSRLKHLAAEERADNSGYS